MFNSVNQNIQPPDKKIAVAGATKPKKQNFLDLLIWFAKNFLNVVIPSRCIGCQKITQGEIVCEKCFSAIKTNQTLFCGKCRARMPLFTGRSTASSLIDGETTSIKRFCHKDFPFVLGSATNYDDKIIKELIHLLKFKYIKSASLPLGKLTANYLKNIGISLKNFSIVPVPLSKNRLKERGFNQSELIARCVANDLGLELVDNGLARAKNSKPQSETKNAIERKENVSGVFSIKNPGAIYGKNLILLDDVITSGSTMEEAARTLKSAGAKKIIAITATMA